MPGKPSAAMADGDPLEKRHKQIDEGISYAYFFYGYFPFREEIMDGLVCRDDGIRYRKRQLRQSKDDKPRQDIPRGWEVDLRQGKPCPGGQPGKIHFEKNRVKQSQADDKNARRPAAVPHRAEEDTAGLQSQF